MPIKFDVPRARRTSGRGRSARTQSRHAFDINSIMSLDPREDTIYGVAEQQRQEIVQEHEQRNREISPLYNRWRNTANPDNPTGDLTPVEWGNLNYQFARSGMTRIDGVRSIDEEQWERNSVAAMGFMDKAKAVWRSANPLTAGVVSGMSSSNMALKGLSYILGQEDNRDGWLAQMIDRTNLPEENRLNLYTQNSPFWRTAIGIEDAAADVVAASLLTRGLGIGVGALARTSVLAPRVNGFISGINRAVSTGKSWRAAIAADATGSAIGAPAAIWSAGVRGTDRLLAASLAAGRKAVRVGLASTAAQTALGPASMFAFAQHYDAMQATKDWTDQEARKSYANWMALSEFGSEFLSDAIMLGVGKRIFGKLVDSPLKSLAGASIRETAFETIKSNAAEISTEMANSYLQTWLGRTHGLTNQDPFQAAIDVIPQSAGVATLLSLPLAIFGIHGARKAIRLANSANAVPGSEGAAQRMSAIDAIAETVNEYQAGAGTVWKKAVQKKVAAGASIDIGESPRTTVENFTGMKLEDAIRVHSNVNTPELNRLVNAVIKAQYGKDVTQLLSVVKEKGFEALNESEREVFKIREAIGGVLGKLFADDATLKNVDIKDVDFKQLQDMAVAALSNEATMQSVRSGIGKDDRLHENPAIDVSLRRIAKQAATDLGHFSDEAIFQAEQAMLGVVKQNPKIISNDGTINNQQALEDLKATLQANKGFLLTKFGDYNDLKKRLLKNAGIKLSTPTLVVTGVPKQDNIPAAKQPTKSMEDPTPVSTRQIINEEPTGEEEAGEYGGNEQMEKEYSTAVAETQTKRANGSSLYDDIIAARNRAINHRLKYRGGEARFLALVNETTRQLVENKIINGNTARNKALVAWSLFHDEKQRNSSIKGMQLVAELLSEGINVNEADFVENDKITPVSTSAIRELLLAQNKNANDVLMFKTHDGQQYALLTSMTNKDGVSNHSVIGVIRVVNGENGKVFVPQRLGEWDITKIEDQLSSNKTDVNFVREMTRGIYQDSIFGGPALRHQRLRYSLEKAKQKKTASQLLKKISEKPVIDSEIKNIPEVFPDDSINKAIYEHIVGTGATRSEAIERMKTLRGTKPVKDFHSKVGGKMLGERTEPKKYEDNDYKPISELREQTERQRSRFGMRAMAKSDLTQYRSEAISELKAIHDELYPQDKFKTRTTAEAFTAFVANNHRVAEFTKYVEGELRAVVKASYDRVYRRILETDNMDKDVPEAVETALANDAKRIRILAERIVNANGVTKMNAQVREYIGFTARAFIIGDDEAGRVNLNVAQPGSLYSRVSSAHEHLALIHDEMTALIEQVHKNESRETQTVASDVLKRRIKELREVLQKARKNGYDLSKKMTERAFPTQYGELATKLATMRVLAEEQGAASGYVDRLEKLMVKAMNRERRRRGGLLTMKGMDFIAEIMGFDHITDDIAKNGMRNSKLIKEFNRRFPRTLVAYKGNSILKTMRDVMMGRYEELPENYDERLGFLRVKLEAMMNFANMHTLVHDMTNAAAQYMLEHTAIADILHQTDNLMDVVDQNRNELDILQFEKALASLNRELDFSRRRIDAMHRQQDAYVRENGKADPELSKQIAETDKQISKLDEETRVRSKAISDIRMRMAENSKSVRFSNIDESKQAEIYVDDGSYSSVEAAGKKIADEIEAMAPAIEAIDESVSETADDNNPIEDMDTELVDPEAEDAVTRGLDGVDNEEAGTRDKGDLNVMLPDHAIARTISLKVLEDVFFNAVMEDMKADGIVYAELSRKEQLDALESYSAEYSELVKMLENPYGFNMKNVEKTVRQLYGLLGRDQKDLLQDLPKNIVFKTVATSDGGAAVKAAVEQTFDNKHIIYLVGQSETQEELRSNTADVFHEFIHVFMNQMPLEERRKLEKTYGVTNGEWSRDSIETFIDDACDYIYGTDHIAADHINAPVYNYFRNLLKNSYVEHYAKKHNFGDKKYRLLTNLFGHIIMPRAYIGRHGETIIRRHQILFNYDADENKWYSNLWQLGNRKTLVDDLKLITELNEERSATLAHRAYRMIKLANDGKLAAILDVYDAEKQYDPSLIQRPHEMIDSLFSYFGKAASKLGLTKLATDNSGYYNANTGDVVGRSNNDVVSATLLFAQKLAVDNGIFDGLNEDGQPAFNMKRELVVELASLSTIDPASVSREKRIDNELLNISEVIGHGQHEPYVKLDMPEWRITAFSKYVLLRTVNPKLAKSLCPEMSKFYTEKLDPLAKRMLKTHSDQVINFLNAPADEKLGRAVERLSSWIAESEKSVGDVIRDYAGEVKAIKDEGTGNFVKRKWDDLYWWTNKQLVDYLAPVVRTVESALEKRGLKMDDVAPSQDIIGAMRRLGNISDMLDVFFNSQYLNYDGTVASRKGIMYRILEPLKAITDNDPKRLYEALDMMGEYLVAQASIERIDNFRDDAMSKLDSWQRIFDTRTKKVKFLRGRLEELKRDMMNDDYVTTMRDLNGIEWLRGLRDAVHADNAELALAAVMKGLETVAKKASGNMTPATAGFGHSYSNAMQAVESIMEKLGGKDSVGYAALEKACAEYRDVARWSLKFQRDAGLITDEEWARSLQNHHYYANLSRQFNPNREAKYDSGVFTERLGKIDKVLWDAKGSMEYVVNPIVGLFDSVERTVEEAYHNKAIVGMRDILVGAREIYGDAVVDMADIGHVLRKSYEKVGDQDVAMVHMPDGKMVAEDALSQGNLAGQPVLVCKVNGHKEYVFFNDLSVYESLSGNTRMLNMSHKAVKILRNTKKLFQDCITITPAFAIRNFFRDSWQRLNLSNNIEQGNFFEACLDLGRPLNEAEIEQFYLAGGGYGYYFGHSDQKWADHLSLTTRKLLGNSKNTVLVHTSPLSGGEPAGEFIPGVRNRRLLGERGATIFNAYQKFLSRSEMMNRIAEFRTARSKAIAMGMGDIDADLYAAAQAREMMDFGRCGQLTRVLDLVMPFLNPRIQGVRYLMKNISEAKPKQLLFRLFMASVIPTLICRAWNAGEDDTEEYLDLPNWQRDSYYNFKLFDGWVCVPKPHDIGVISSMLEYHLDMATGNEQIARKRYDEFAFRLMSALNPFNFESNIVQPLLDVRANLDSFTGNPIVSPYEIGKALPLRKGAERASSLGKFFSNVLSHSLPIEAIKDVDPRHIDYLFKKMTGPIGQGAFNYGRPGNNDVQTMLNVFFGLYKPAAGASSRSVSTMLENSRAMGLSNRKEYRGFSENMREVLAQNGNEGYAEELRRLRRRAKEMMPDTEIDIEERAHELAEERTQDNG